MILGDLVINKFTVVENGQVSIYGIDPICKDKHYESVEVLVCGSVVLTP